jgi:L-amino acid N-acyltransferase YncA
MLSVHVRPFSSEDEGPVHGWVVLFHFYTDDEVLVFMLVAPHARGSGLGQRLMREALAATTASICKADVDAGNLASVACARAAGFVEMAPPEPRDIRFLVWTRDGRASSRCGHDA